MKDVREERISHVMLLAYTRIGGVRVAGNAVSQLFSRYYGEPFTATTVAPSQFRVHKVFIR